MPAHEQALRLHLLPQTETEGSSSMLVSFSSLEQTAEGFFFLHATGDWTHASTYFYMCCTNEHTPWHFLFLCGDKVFLNCPAWGWPRHNLNLRSCCFSPRVSDMCYYARFLSTREGSFSLLTIPRFQAKVIWIHCCEPEAVHCGGRSMWQKPPLLWHLGNQRKIGMSKQQDIFSQDSFPHCAVISFL